MASLRHAIKLINFRCLISPINPRVTGFRSSFALFSSLSTRKSLYHVDMAFEGLFGSEQGLLIPYLPHAGLYQTIGSLSAGENPAVCFAVYVNRAVEQRSASMGRDR